MADYKSPLRVGHIAVVTNDIYTKEDQRILTQAEALEPERIVGVETGGCPHTAIREDASMNLAAVEALAKKFGNLDVVFVESGGDNLSATFSPELADLTIYVIDVASGEKIPRKGGPGITKSDLLVINKIDLADLVGANLSIMDSDTKRMRGEKPYVFSNLRTDIEGLNDIIIQIHEQTDGSLSHLRVRKVQRGDLSPRLVCLLRLLLIRWHSTVSAGTISFLTPYP